MAAHQAPPSLGFSRQEHWNGLPLPSPLHESEKWKWSLSVVSGSLWPHARQPTRLLSHGIFQARVLEWVATAFSGEEYICPQMESMCLLSTLYNSVTCRYSIGVLGGVGWKKWEPQITTTVMKLVNLKDIDGKMRKHIGILGHILIISYWEESDY